MFRDGISELKDESCIEIFMEQLKDHVKLRPVGFKVDKFEPEKVNLKEYISLEKS